MKRLTKRFLPILALSALLSSCGEEVLTQNTLSETDSGADLETFHYSTCAAMRFVKPPVDILFVVDNSGSTLQESFAEIKGEIAATVSTISNEFDYHAYIVPLHQADGEDISGYPLIVSDRESLKDQTLLTIPLEQINAQTFFSQAGGGNVEHGYQRVYNVINQNRENGIFRDNAHTISVMISNGYDTDTLPKIGGQPTFDSSVFNAKKNQFISLSSDLSASSFRFISLTPHSNCNGWKAYANYGYKKMSLDLGSATMDLCSGNYGNLFTAVNKSIRQVLVGHKYDHWKISSASESEIQSDDITIKKVLPSGTETAIPSGSAEQDCGEDSNHFVYLGKQEGINTRYAPDAGEPVTGLVIKLCGEARVKYDENAKRPECISAKTRTPTEYFGYVVLPREPQLGTVKIEINGVDISNGSQNGWTYEGYQTDKNTKVEKNGAKATPSLKKTGYFLKLNGNAVFSNGDKINVYYKPKSI